MADFISTVMEMRDGKVAAQINQKFAELMTAIAEHQGKGNISLKLTVVPTKMGLRDEISEVEIDYDITVKKPFRKHTRSQFFMTQDGQLSRQDPNQFQMDFERKEVKQ
jgi:uncharacterized beta-barrel protein YwiB (DUF1934 family)